MARQDWALSSEENELGVHALAVPLRNAQGATVAALNVIVPPARFSDALMQQELLPRLREAARELRQML